jgi:hypothetical protein
VGAEALDRARARVLEELHRADLLGFDSEGEALRAVLAHSDYAQRWECPAGLVRAVEEYRSLRLAARVAGLRP